MMLRFFFNSLIDDATGVSPLLTAITKRGSLVWWQYNISVKPALSQDSYPLKGSLTIA